MSSLHEIQRDFLDSVYSRDVADLAATHLLAGKSGAGRSLAIYRNNTFTNLRSALRSAYPVLTRLVGEEFFNFAATEYIFRHPSLSGDLHNYGEWYGKFLEEFPPVAELPYLPDVARLEWACHTAFFAADHPMLDLRRLALIPDEQYHLLSFQLHPACRMLESPFPIDKIWLVNQDGFTGDPRVNLAEGPVRLFVSRPFHHPQVNNLTECDWHFLASLSVGDPLGIACEQALQFSSDFNLGLVLQNLIDKAVLVDFSLITDE